MAARYSLPKILKPDVLRALTSATAYERGAAYYQRGQVISLTEREEMILAVVQGTKAYEVRMWVRAGRLQFTCDCPYASEGAFCKHCVAAGLAWLDARASQ